LLNSKVFVYCPGEHWVSGLSPSSKTLKEHNSLESESVPIPGWKSEGHILTWVFHLRKEVSSLSETLCSFRILDIDSPETHQSEINSSYLCNHVTICSSSTDDEPDSLSLHVSSTDEGQRLWNQLETITLKRPISSSVSLHSSLTDLLYWTYVNIRHASVPILTRQLTINCYKMSPEDGNKCTYSKSLTLIGYRKTRKNNRCLLRPICSSTRLTVIKTIQRRATKWYWMKPYKYRRPHF
jgi:hypothetical protein